MPSLEKMNTKNTYKRYKLFQIVFVYEIVTLWYYKRKYPVLEGLDTEHLSKKSYLSSQSDIVPKLFYK